MGEPPRKLGVRAGATLVAAVTVGVALGLGAWVFLNATRARIEGGITDAATDRLEGILELARSEGLPNPLPGPTLELFTQVVDGDGSVRAADRALQGFAPLTDLTLAGGEQRTVRYEHLFPAGGGMVDEGPYVAVAEGFLLEGEPATVIVAGSLEDADEAVGAVAPLLAVGLPALAALVGLVTWLLTGRALAPVEAMRAEADRISMSDLHRRLPQPGASDEVGRLAGTLNRMLERLEGSVSRQRAFVADASHELRSPLAAMRTMVEVATDPGGELSSELAGDLQAELDRMQRLVDDLLLLARRDEGRPSEPRLPVALEALLGEEAGRLEQRSGLAVHRDLLPAVVEGDALRLTQLVRNLVDNAARHAKSAVWVGVGPDRGEAVLTVSDDGAGIPVEDRERVFERFVRLDESRSRDQGGSGLGLAVARAIAESHGGRLRVVEPRHGGATLEARLPLRP